VFSEGSLHRQNELPLIQRLHTPPAGGSGERSAPGQGRGSRPAAKATSLTRRFCLGATPVIYSSLEERSKKDEEAIRLVDRSPNLLYNLAVKITCKGDGGDGSEI